MRRSSSKKPYSLGYNGHAKSCDCPKCARSHAEAVKSLWEQNGSYAVPKSADETVFVRSYFRRQPNHFAKKPDFAKAMRNFVASIRKARKV